MIPLHHVIFNMYDVIQDDPQGVTMLLAHHMDLPHLVVNLVHNLGHLLDHIPMSPGPIPGCHAGQLLELTNGIILCLAIY